MKKASSIFFTLATTGMIAVSWAAMVPNGRLREENQALEPYYWEYPALFIFYVFVAYCVFRPYSFSWSWRRSYALAIITSVFAWLFMVFGMHQPLTHYYFFYALASYFLLLVFIGSASIFMLRRNGSHLW